MECSATLYEVYAPYDVYVVCQMTALMGSSGAGKTTLLDVLAGRKTGGTVAGEIRLNGHPKVQKTFNRQARK